MFPSIDGHRIPTSSRSCGLAPARRKGRALSARRIGGGRTDEGVSLVEVLVASVILLVTMIPMGYLLTSVSSGAVAARQRQAAEQLADSWIQILSNSPPPLQSDGTTPLLNQSTSLTDAYATNVLNVVAPQSLIAGTQFTPTSVYTYNSVNNAGQSDLCSAGTPPSPSNPAVLQVNVTVTWGPNNASSVTNVTHINWPQPSGPQTKDGYLSISVSNEGKYDVFNNNPQTRLQAIPVLVSGGAQPYTLYPDINGCIFAQVPAAPTGTIYTISVEQPSSGIPSYPGPPGAPPFVNQSNLTAANIPAQQATVFPGLEAAPVQFNGFDEGMNANISYGGGSSVDAGVECPGTASLTCLTIGSGTTGASAAWGTTSSQWTSSTLLSGSHINQVACTTTSAKCVGVGYRTTGGSNVGLVLSTTSDLNTTAVDSIPAGVTDITQVTCPSSQGCYALGSGASGPLLLAGRIGSGTDVWQIVTPPLVNFLAMNSIACPTSNTCELAYAGTAGAAGILRLDGDPAGLGGNAGWTPTVTSDVLPSTSSGSSYNFASIGTITCPSTSVCLATAVGDASSPTDATIAEATVAAAGASTWGAEATFPTGASTVTGISCWGTSCVAVGTAAPNAVGNAAVWTGDLTSTPDNWVQTNGIPASVENVNGVACGKPTGSDTADCAISAESTSGGGTGQLLVGSLLGSWSWNFVPAVSNGSVQYYQGVACLKAPSAGCAAVGESLTGPVILTSSAGPNGSWTTQTPSSMSGAAVSGIPIQVAPSSTTAWSTQVAAGGPTNATTLPNPLYPWANGYTIATGDCGSEAVVTSTLKALPGDTGSSIIPLGVLPLSLVNSNGLPVIGATVTLTATSCGIDGDTYNMPITDATGTTAISVPYGTYSYSVTEGATAVAPTNLSLSVGPSTVTITNSATPAAAPAITYLPSLVQVPA